MADNENGMCPNADYFDGRSAEAHPAFCSLIADMLEVRTPEGDRLAAWPLDGVFADAPEKSPLRLRPGQGGERLVVRDAQAAATLRERLAPVLARRRARRRGRWFLGAAAVWLAVICLWFAFPLLVRGVTALVPYAWEQALGEGTRDTVGRYISGAHTGEVPWRDAGPGYDALTALVARLAAAGPDAEYAFRVSVLDAKLVNAFALPGGYIVVTTGLIRQCRDADELAGVLAHEMAHVTERHNVRHLVRNQFFTFIISMLSGGSDVMDLFHSAGNAMVNSKFSREDEREADILGVARLARAGVDPESTVKFFSGTSRKQGGSGGFSYFDSHPRLDERMAYMRNEAAAYPGPFTPALSREQWRALRALAGKDDRYGTI